MKIELLEKRGIKFGLKLIDDEETIEIISQVCDTGLLPPLYITYSNGRGVPYYFSNKDENLVYVLHKVAEKLCHYLKRDKNEELCRRMMGNENH